MASAPPKDLSIPGGRKPPSHAHLQLLLLLVMLVVGVVFSDRPGLASADSLCVETGMQNNTGASSFVAGADFDDGNEFPISLYGVNGA